jgi:hypothetical protein
LIKTKIGISCQGQEAGLEVIRGKNALRDFQGWGYWRHLIFLASGADIGDKNDRVLTDILISCNYVDLRIWCNTVAFLMAQDGVTSSYAYAGTLAATYGTTYGVGPCTAAAELLVEFEKCISLKSSLPHWVKSRPGFPGFLRPVKESDERNPFFLHILKNYGVTNLKYVRLAFLLEKVANQYGNKKYEINGGGLLAAILLDLGVPLDFLSLVLATLSHNGTIGAYAAGMEASDDDTISYSTIRE